MRLSYEEHAPMTTFLGELNGEVFEIMIVGWSPKGICVLLELRDSGQRIWKRAATVHPIELLRQMTWASFKKAQEEAQEKQKAPDSAGGEMESTEAAS